MKKLFALVNPLWCCSPGRLPTVWSAIKWSCCLYWSPHGRPYRIPVSFVRDGADILCMTQADGVWWRNLLDAASVQVTLSRKVVATVAVVESEDYCRDCSGFTSILFAQPHKRLLCWRSLIAKANPSKKICGVRPLHRC